MSAATELMLPAQEQALTPAAAYAPGAIDRLLQQIAQQARAHQPDLTTVAGRKAVASVAYRVARSKTALDDMGKRLVADWKQQASVVDAERRRLRDTLDALAAEVRQPLTEWEAEQARREAEIKERITAIRDMAFCEPDSAAIQTQIAAAQAVVISEEDFGAWAGQAALAKDGALTRLRDALAEAVRREAEEARIEAERVAEAARLEAERTAQAEREAQERAAREAAEAEARRQREAEAERLRAEAAARSEAERAERERQAETRRAAEIERMKVQAEEDAKRREVEAAERERRRIAAEEEAKRAEAARRAADQEHRRRINNEALAAIVATGVTDKQAKAIVLAIVSGEVPHVGIRY